MAEPRYPIEERIVLDFNRETYSYTDSGGRKAYAVDLEKSKMAETEAFAAYLDEHGLSYYECLEHIAVAFFANEIEMAKLMLAQGHFISDYGCGFDMSDYYHYFDTSEFTEEERRKGVTYW